MNNCTPNRDDDNALGTNDATPFLSIIQALPASNYDPGEGTVPGGSVPIIPCNIFSDLTSTFSYDTASFHPAQTNEWKRCESSSVCSVLTEQRDCFELGRDAGSPTRHLRHVDASRVHAKHMEGDERFPPLLDEIKRGMVSKSHTFENGWTLDAVTECSESTRSEHRFESTNPCGKSSSPDHEKGSKYATTVSSIKTALEKTKVIDKNKILNSSIAEKAGRKVQLLKRLKSKLSSRVIATTDTAVEIPMEPEGRATTRAVNENDNPNRSSSVTIQGNASMDPLLVDMTSLTLQDKRSVLVKKNMSVDRKKEETSDEKFRSYNEICYGAASPTTAIALTPSPVNHFDNGNSIRMKSTKKSRKKEMSIPQESTSYEMPCNLSPILEKPSRERAASYHNLGLDATESMTATPNDSYMLNLSRDSAQESYSERSSSLLHDVSRTLFPEELEGHLPEVFKEDTSLGTRRYACSEGLDDDNDYEALTIECTLQNNPSGLFDVTVEEVEVNDVNALKEEGLNCGERGIEKPKENGTVGVIVSSKLGDRPKMKGNNIFQKDKFSFGDLFGCVGASSFNAASVGK